MDTHGLRQRGVRTGAVPADALAGELMAPTAHEVALPARIESALAGVLVALAVLGLALLPVASRPVVGVLVGAVDASATSGLDPVLTRQTAEAVRRFVLDPDAPALPAKVGGRPGFDADAVAHLIDVRNVMVPARTLTIVLVVAIAAWFVLRSRSAAGKRIVGGALTSGGLVLLGAGGIAAFAGLIDFPALFAWFHTLFFAEGTWLFPSDALLIGVFPLPFWVAAGALWASLVLLLAAALVIAGRRMSSTASVKRV